MTNNTQIKSKPLNEKRELFCEYYILYNKNGAKAARMAGYSKNSAAQQAHRLLEIDEVQKRIEELESGNEILISRLEKIEMLKEIIRDRNHQPTQRIKALEYLEKMEKEGNIQFVTKETEPIQDETVKNSNLSIEQLNNFFESMEVKVKGGKNE